MFDVVVNYTGSKPMVWCYDVSKHDALDSVRALINYQIETRNLVIYEPFENVSAYTVRKAGRQIIASWIGANGREIEVWLVAERKAAVWLVYHDKAEPSLLLSGEYNPASMFIRCVKRWPDISDYFVRPVDGVVLLHSKRVQHVMYAQYREIDA